MQCITMHTMATISLRVEDSFVKELEQVEKNWQADRSEVVRRLLNRSLQEWKIERNLELLREGKISIGKAAEECALPLWEMLEVVKTRAIDWTGYSSEDLERDLLKPGRKR